MHMINTVFQKYVLVTLALILLSGCAMLTPRAKPDHTVEIADMDFVFVKGGTFQMGGTERPDEQPVHTVTVPDLFVGMYEVTFDQFDKYCATDPLCEPPYDNKWGRGDRPVIHVAWRDANVYAAWLSEQTGLQFRLPTESEWEYFARAGTTTHYWTDTTLPKGSANCEDCGSKWDNQMTAPVGSFKPNPWKIYDTIGNVIEWVADDYTKGYSNAPADGSAHIINKNEAKVQRGGAFDYPAKDTRSSARDYRKAKQRNKDAGFRLVLEPSRQIPVPPTK